MPNRNSTATITTEMQHVGVHRLSLGVTYLSSGGQLEFLVRNQIFASARNPKTPKRLDPIIQLHKKHIKSCFQHSYIFN